MISFALSAYSVNGFVFIDEDKQETKVSDVTRRVSRVRTLDGNAVVNDGGYSEADRTITVVFRGQQEAAEKVYEMIKSTGKVIMSAGGQVFEGYIQNISQNRNRTTVTYLPLRTL